MKLNLIAIEMKSYLFLVVLNSLSTRRHAGTPTPRNALSRRRSRSERINIQVESELSTTRSRYDFISIAITLSFVDMASSGLSIDTATVATQSDAKVAIGTMDTALQTISQEQAKFGSLINRLDYSISNQSRASVMTEQALGRIMDADFATESTALSKSQILNQAATSMLAQANQSKSLLLQLIQ